MNIAMHFVIKMFRFLQVKNYLCFIRGKPQPTLKQLIIWKLPIRKLQNLTRSAFQYLDFTILDHFITHQRQL